MTSTISFLISWRLVPFGLGWVQTQSTPQKVTKLPIKLNHPLVKMLICGDIFTVWLTPYKIMLAILCFRSPARLVASEKDWVTYVKFRFMKSYNGYMITISTESITVKLNFISVCMRSRPTILDNQVLIFSYYLLPKDRKPVWYELGLWPSHLTTKEPWSSC